MPAQNRQEISHEVAEVDVESFGRLPTATGLELDRLRGNGEVYKLLETGETIHLPSLYMLSIGY